MAKKITKQEALSVGRLISEVLVEQLGIPLRNIVNDTTFAKYTGAKRPDILISNVEYDGSNESQYIGNLVAYAEAKDTSCVIDDTDWKDAYKQGMQKAPKLGLPFFGVTNCKTTYFYNVKTGNRISLNGNVIYEFQTLDMFRIMKKKLQENPNEDDIKIGIDSLAAVSEAVFNKKMWELKEEYRAIGFENNTQKIDFTVGMIALEYYEEKAEIDGTKDDALQYWSDCKEMIPNPQTFEHSNTLATILVTYIDRLTGDESDFKEFAPLLKKVKELISGSKALVVPNRLQSIYFIIDSMRPLHGAGFDLFGAIYENFANSKEKKDFGEYFTRRHYAHVFAKLLLQSENIFNPDYKFSIIDPACGTGGMLTESFKVLRNNYENSGTYDSDSAKFLAENCFYGIDVRGENISRTRLNMFLVGDGHTNMHSDDSLNPTTKKGKEYLSQKYRYVITNPPYGQGTELANTDSINSYRFEIAFICKIIDLLERKGQACIITPDGILENPSLKKFRDEILKSCEIYAIVSLPKFAFAPYTKEKTYALFIRKLHDRPSADDKKKKLPTGNYQTNSIWMYIIDNDGFANSDKRFPTRLRDDTQKWLHDEVSGYADSDGIERNSILEQRWLKFDDAATQGTEWVDEGGALIKERKGGFIDFDTIKNDEFLTLLPEYYLRPYEPHFISEKELETAILDIEKELRGIIDEVSGCV
ncbi:MAG: N-6 DNA methylase [Pseudobutyrivibrio sp.]|uniref:HsdM family class I SAM-dependent methyltransferase n=1 Tax=Pseudobutyrivibrio sp. TaxID=2014367 RepID=UPI0025CE01DC|nr:N-6 DNA methylase [Pseudobutyrivibrio sp.]MBQ6462215.1 N-6 DNA methylase [Pseudobutyrivibrio sp.]